MPSGFGEESEQDVKEAVKPSGCSYAWEELAKYNERHNTQSKSIIIIHQAYRPYAVIIWPSQTCFLISPLHKILLHAYLLE